MAPVDTITSAAAFDALLGSSPATAVHFWAAWCEPCKAMDQLMNELAAARPDVRFARVEAEEIDELAERYDVSAVPFFTFHRGNSLVDKLEGADAKGVATKISEHFGATATATASAPPPPAATAKTEEDLDARLGRLTTQSPVVLFMKGTKEEPRCGFSRKVVEAVNGTGVAYTTFDILSDEEVRQGLKTYSNWPTYPQLYAGGELVGGCDIVLEMAGAGELKGALEEAAASGKKDLHARLRSLVTAAPVVLFMKGTEEEPRCGFSRKVVEAIKDTGVAFSTFDILAGSE